MTTTDEAAALVNDLRRNRTFANGCVQISEGLYYRVLAALTTERDHLLASQERAIAEAVALVVQYRDDLRHGLSDDSRDRRLVAITAFLALHAQEIK